MPAEADKRRSPKSPSPSTRAPARKGDLTQTPRGHALSIRRQPPRRHDKLRQAVSDEAAVAKKKAG